MKFAILNLSFLQIFFTCLFIYLMHIDVLLRVSGSLGLNWSYRQL